MGCGLKCAAGSWARRRRSFVAAPPGAPPSLPNSFLPFLAQGGAMAIEDAAVVADCLARCPDQPALAFEIYEGLRRPRTQRVARESHFNGFLYHLRGPAAVARNLVLGRLTGEKLL